MAETLFMFSFGVAHPNEPFSKGKKNSNLAKRKKEHFKARKRRKEFSSILEVIPNAEFMFFYAT